MLDLHRLRVFRTVVATGSVTGAATSLGYTSSAVSQQLSALQRETGLVLLERRGRGIAPTAAGTVFAEQLDGVFERLAHVDGVVGDLRAGRTGTLTVSYFASAGTAWIPPVAGRARARVPGPAAGPAAHRAGGEDPAEADLEIRVDGHRPRRAPTTGRSSCYASRTWWCSPTAHPLAGRAAIPLAELRDELWVDNDFSRGLCRQIVLDACAAAGFAPTFRIETHDYPSAIAFVAEGVGITVLPRLGAAPSCPPAGVRAVPVVEPGPAPARSCCAPGNAVRRPPRRARRATEPAARARRGHRRPGLTGAAPPAPLRHAGVGPWGWRGSRPR